MKTTVYTLSLLVSACGVAFSDQPLATFAVKEMVGIDWPRTLVTYRLKFEPGRVHPGKVRLVDARDREHPCQLWRVKLHPDGSLASARASFLAELAKGGSYSFRLLPGRPTATVGNLEILHENSWLTLDNGITAIRLPKAGEHECEEPLVFGNNHVKMLELYGRQVSNGIAPGPIQGIRLVDGRWVGGSYFRAENPGDAPKVTGFSCQITERGPLFVEARVRYRFEGSGFYEMAARVSADDPAIRIDEQFDMALPDPTGGWPGKKPPGLQVVVSLSGEGWRPDLAYYVGTEGNLKGHVEELEEKFKALGTQKPVTPLTFGSKRLAFEESVSKTLDITAWYPWHPAAFCFGLVESDAATTSTRRKDIPFVGVVPMHAGNWRGAHGTYRTISLMTGKDGDTFVRWPLRVESHPNTLLHTGEHDPELPFAFCRRQWGLLSGPLHCTDDLYAFRAQQGSLTLDDYKDWILEWPETQSITYPRMVFSAEDVRRLKPTLAGHPAGKVLNQFLYFQDPPNKERKKALWGKLSAHPKSLRPQRRSMAFPLGMVHNTLEGVGWHATPWWSSFRQAMMVPWVHEVEELFAAGDLDKEQRGVLRCHLATLCYIMTEPDFHPRGAMIHLGNPNMPINRFFALPIIASLLPDHPMAGEWMAVSSEYVRYKLAMNTAPNGAWSELISYFMSAYPHILQGATVMSKGAEISGMEDPMDEATRRLAALPSKFTINLLTPRDPRLGTRILPGWGHEGNNTFQHWLLTAGMIRNLDPGLSQALAWGWDQVGRPMGDYNFMDHEVGFTKRVALHADLLNELPNGFVPRELESTWLPGFGATMRAHAGDPNETYLSYRQGYFHSHSDENQGDFILYSKGAPLVMMGPRQYSIKSTCPKLIKLYKSFGWHSRVHFGDQLNTGGWPGGGAISQVHHHFFSNSADYLRALGDYGPQRWTRQILFLKGKAASGPNYFVFSDSFHNLDGQADKLEKKWWFLKTVGYKDTVEVSRNTIQYTGPFGPGMNIRFLQPAGIQTQTRDADCRGSADDLNTFAVTAVGPIGPGQDIFTVLYPQAAEETVPNYQLLADGVAKITTSEGTDFVFVNRKPMKYADGKVAFKGISGAVRVYPEEVHLLIAEGPGEVSYQGTVLRSPVPVHKVFPLPAARKNQVIQIRPPGHSIRFKLSHEQGEQEEIDPGVNYQKFHAGFSYAFESENRLRFEKDGVTFTGRRGGITVNEEKKTVRLVLIKGSRIGYHDLQAWDCPGPYEITFHNDHVTGRTAGQGRFLYLSMPRGLNRLPTMVLDGQTYAPGTSGNTLIVPVMPGEHALEIRALKQPRIWRNWQAW